MCTLADGTLLGEVMTERWRAGPGGGEDDEKRGMKKEKSRVEG